MNFIVQYNEFCLNYLKSIKKIARSFSLTQAQVLCIQSIPYDGISQINLSNKLCLDVSTVSRNLEKLKEMQIIDKAKSTYDQRSSIITLTEKGKIFYKQIIEIIQNDINKIVVNIDIEDLDYFTELLNKINWEFELSNNRDE